MNTILWIKNKDRKIGGDILLTEDNEQFYRLSPEYTYCFRRKSISGKYSYVCYFRVLEIAFWVFSVEAYTFDSVLRSGIKNISITLSENGRPIILNNDEFDGYVYRMKIESGIYDLEGLNNVFFDIKGKEDSFEISTLKVFDAAYNMMQKLFTNKNL